MVVGCSGTNESEVAGPLTDADERRSAETAVLAVGRCVGQ